MSVKRLRKSLKDDKNYSDNPPSHKEDNKSFNSFFMQKNPPSYLKRHLIKV